MAKRKHNLVPRVKIPRIDIPNINIPKTMRDTKNVMHDVKDVVETTAAVIGIIISIRNGLK